MADETEPRPALRGLDAWAALANEQPIAFGVDRTPIPGHGLFDGPPMTRWERFRFRFGCWVESLGLRIQG